MKVPTDTDRVRHSRKLVMEFLASSVDMDARECRLAPLDGRVRGRAGAVRGADGADAGGGARPRETRPPPRPVDPTVAETVAQPVKIDNELYVRDYARCVLCYKCVEACGTDAQHTFAIAVAGRGFDARISTEYAVPLDESACVYCGNCIGVCPTGALMFTSEHDMREAGTWDETAQTVTNTICPYCGVGCELELHVQDNEIVKVTSPVDHSVTNGHLCIKGRFGFPYVQSRGSDPTRRQRRDGRGRRVCSDCDLVSGIVLAGGRSTRFGVPTSSRPMSTAHRSCTTRSSALAKVTRRRRDRDRPPGRARSLRCLPDSGVRSTSDAAAVEGPLAGALAGARAAGARSSPSSSAATCPSSQPGCSREMLRVPRPMRRSTPSPSRTVAGSAPFRACCGRGRPRVTPSLLRRGRAVACARCSTRCDGGDRRGDLDPPRPGPSDARRRGRAGGSCTRR